MAFICSCESYLAVAASSNVFIMDRNLENESSSERLEPSVLSATVPNGGYVKENGEDDGQDDEKDNGKDDEKTNVDYSSTQVLAACFSKTGRLFALCNNRKQLIVWINNQGGWRVHRHWPLKKQASAVVFAGAEENAVLVSDRFGQVTQYNLQDLDSSGTVLLGHTSVLLDLCLASSGRFLMTAERDEKIRVSNYPHCYDIQSYCLGHTEYVKTLCLLPGLHENDKDDGIVASGGGDGLVKLWRCVDGAQLASFDLGEDEQTGSTGVGRKRCRKIMWINTKKIDERTIRLAVLCEGSPDLIFLDISCTQHGDYMISEVTRWSNASNSLITDITSTDGRLYLLTRSSQDPSLIEIDGTSRSPVQIHSRVLKALNECDKLIQSITQSKDESPPMEKTVQYDNVEEYFQRKRARTAAEKIK